MAKRKEAYSPVWKVIVLGIVTLGIYLVYWAVTRKIFLNKKGAEIPTAWLIIIPLVNYYFYYKLCEGWSKVCERKSEESKWVMFLVWVIIPFVSAALMQEGINNKFYPGA